MSLTCPKCQGTMRQYERSSVHVDQCTECRGVFLDRGELEKLIDADAAWADSAGRPAPAPAAPQHPQAYQQAHPPASGHRVQGYRDQYDKKNRKRSFLDELFD